jgi:O-antigen ligase
MESIKSKLNIKSIHVFFTCVLVALIPYAVVLVTYGILFWIVTAIILMVRHKGLVSKFEYNTGFILCLLAYLIFVIGVFYSNNTDSAIFDIQVKLSMILIPPVIFLLRDFYKKYFNIILLAFLVINIILAIICLFNAFYNSTNIIDGTLTFSTSVPGKYQDQNTGIPSYFAYSNFSLFKHPTYFSMYLLLCLFSIIYFIRNSYYLFKSKKASIIIYCLAMVFIVIIIYFLESKAAYFSLLFLTFAYSLFYLIKKKKWVLCLLIIFALGIFGYIAYKNNSRFYYINSALKNRTAFIDVIKKKDYQALIDTYGIDRIPIWMLSVELIKENFWTGVGSGDVSDNLMKKYKYYKLISLEQKGYNSHNQYLETFISVGIFGFLIFIAWLFYPLFLQKSYRKENFLILIFCGIIIINFFFEAALNIISGVIFIAFFYSFLLFVSGNQIVTKNNQDNF